ncbi:HotDog domain-containing protein [Bipolaris maydis]|nr:HotDog domain-containing protein [Bipolaris maydis]
MHVISASRNDVEGKGNEAEATFELEVIPQLCNPMNNMHGGAMALLVDMTTTMAGAPISRQGWWEFGGVSRTLSVTYVRPALLGTTVAVTCVLRSVSSRLSVTQFIARDKVTGKLLALAEHGKSALVAQVHPEKAGRL